MHIIWDARLSGVGRSRPSLRRGVRPRVPDNQGGAEDQRFAVGDPRTSGASATVLLSTTALASGWSNTVDSTPAPASSTELVIRSLPSPSYALMGSAAMASRITPRPG